MDKKKILSILPDTQELQGDTYMVKLYSSDKEGKNWLFSDVEGYICYIIDYNAKTKYIVIYDPTSYEKLFQYELYNNFGKSFEELAPDFRGFEIDSGFLGLQFENKDDAIEFESIIKRFGNLDLFNKKPNISADDVQIRNEKAKLYCKTLKRMYCEDENKYDENYAEDGTEILKHKNFKILSNITYDKDEKKFKFGKISEELKEMFVAYGIRKKDLENDADFAFTLFKKVIVGLGNEQKLKNSAVDNIEHNFPPPEEREKLRKQEELAEAKMNDRKNKRNQVKRKEKKKAPAQTKPQPRPKPQQQQKPAESTKESVPEAPPVPAAPVLEIPQAPSLPVPAAPSCPIPAPQSTSSTPVETKESTEQKKPELSMEEQLKSIKLKKVTVSEQSNTEKITGENKNFLQNALSTAIRNRNKALHMHDDEDEDSDDNDWD